MSATDKPAAGDAVIRSAYQLGLRADEVAADYRNDRRAFGYFAAPMADGYRDGFIAGYVESLEHHEAALADAQEEVERVLFTLDAAIGSSGATRVTIHRTRAVQALKALSIARARLAGEKGGS